MPYGMDGHGPPNLSHAGDAEFGATKDQWWSRFTNVFRFARMIKPAFGYRLATDGESVSVLFIKTTPAAEEQAAAVSGAEERATQRNCPTSAPPSDRDWVRGPSVPSVTSSRRVLGLDPGDKAVFTAVVHTPVAQQTLQSAEPIRYKIFCQCCSKALYSSHTSVILFVSYFCDA